MSQRLELLRLHFDVHLRQAFAWHAALGSLSSHRWQGGRGDLRANRGDLARANAEQFALCEHIVVLPAVERSSGSEHPQEPRRFVVGDEPSRDANRKLVAQPPAPAPVEYVTTPHIQRQNGAEILE